MENIKNMIQKNIGKKWNKIIQFVGARKMNIYKVFLANIRCHCTKLK
jgi:hypothetical protein